MVCFYQSNGLKGVSKVNFFRKNEQVKFQMGDVVRFKNNDEREYHYAIISELPDGAVDEEDGICKKYAKYAAIILNNDGHFLRPGVIYHTGETEMELMKRVFGGWDIVEKARTRTEDLTD